MENLISFIIQGKNKNTKNISAPSIMLRESHIQFEMENMWNTNEFIHSNATQLPYKTGILFKYKISY